MGYFLAGAPYSITLTMAETEERYMTNYDPESWGDIGIFYV